jgi:hypothetical protein
MATASPLTRADAFVGRVEELKSLDAKAQFAITVKRS